MHYSVSFGSFNGQYIVIEQSARHALQRIRKLEADGQPNVKVSHPRKGDLSVGDLEEIIAREDPAMRPTLKK